MKAHLQTYVRQRISTEDERRNIFAIISLVFICAFAG